MNFSNQFLQELQAKKKLRNQQIKEVKVDLEQIQHRTQIPSVKIQNQRIKITQDEFLFLIRAVKPKLIKQSSLLNLQGPIYVSTGTYGSYHQLSLIFQKCGNPKFVNYLFLGDYTGKYERGIQCLVTLLLYKLKFSSNFFLLRGSFQSISAVKNYNLYEEIIDFFGSLRVWTQIAQLFCCLPFAATINDKILCVHGGISPYLFSLQQINLIKRPFDTPKKNLPHQLIFAHPSYLDQNSENQTLTNTFTEKIVEDFFKRTSLKVICRHSIVENGFEFIFNKSVINLCSISNFCGIYSNSSAVLMIDDHFNLIFKQISSQISPKSQQNQEGLTFQQIIELRQQKKYRLQELEKKQEQKQKQMELNKQKTQKQKEIRQQRRLKKQQKKKQKRLKSEMLKQKEEKQILIKQNQIPQSL